MNDTGSYCKCETCTAQQAEYGVSGWFYRAINKIAARLKEAKPNVKLDTIAYSYAIDAPDIVLEDKYKKSQDWVKFSPPKIKPTIKNCRKAANFPPVYGIINNLIMDFFYTTKHIVSQISLQCKSLKEFFFRLVKYIVSRLFSKSSFCDNNLCEVLKKVVSHFRETTFCFVVVCI